MVYSQLKHLALSAALLTLVGCASAPKTPSSVNQPSLEMATLVGNAAPGDTLSLPANNPLGVDTVIVDRTYFAASGRECRRLLDVNRAPIQRVACKSEDGQWRFARDLKSVSTMSAPSADSEMLVQSAGSAMLLSEEGHESSVVVEDTISELVTMNESVDVTDYSSVALAEANEEVDDVDMVQRKLQTNETLWKFSKRTTGNALNWKTIADINNVDDTKKLVSGAQLNIPAALVTDGG